MTFPSDIHDDYSVYGFKAEEIYPFLARYHVVIDRTGGPGTVSVKQSVEPSPPEWKRVLAALPYLSIGEAARAFVNIDPHDSGWLSDDDHTNITRYSNLITRAVYATDPGDRLEALNALDPKTAEPTGEWEIKHADLAAWCSKKGFDYPLPALSPRPATDAEALVEIERLRRDLALAENKIFVTEIERDEWRAKAEQTVNTSELSDRIAQLEAEVSEKQKEIEHLTELVPPRTEFLIPIVVAVQKMFWGNWKEGDVRPKAKETIMPWIESNFPGIAHSKLLMQAVERVACPFNRDPNQP